MLAPAATLIAFSLVALSKTNDTLLATSAFTSLTILSLIGPPLATFIQTVPNPLATHACLGRIQALLEMGTSQLKLQYSSDYVKSAQCNSGTRVIGVDGRGQGIELQSFSRPSASDRPQPVLEIFQADISWPRRSNPILKGITLSISSSQLLVVTGPVGCGKSTLLQALIGKAAVLNGYMRKAIDGTAFYDQTAWLRNSSIRENITAGSEFEHTWYESVIKACDLVMDINSFIEGDAFLVGSNGSSLSGGQRHRVVCTRYL